MTVHIYHVAGYSHVDDMGQELIDRAGEYHASVAEARKAVECAMQEMPECVRREGPPRINWEQGNRRGII